MDLANYLGLADIAKITPTSPTHTTVWRWCRRGIQGVDGSTISLRYVRIGGRIFSTEAWLHDFFAAVSAADSPGPSPASADAELQRAGM